MSDKAGQDDVHANRHVTTREQACGAPTRLSDEELRHKGRGELCADKAGVRFTCANGAEGGLLHRVASVLSPESCNIDDCGREGTARFVGADKFGATAIVTASLGLPSAADVDAGSDAWACPCKDASDIDPTRRAARFPRKAEQQTTTTRWRQQQSQPHTGTNKVAFLGTDLT